MANRLPPLSTLRAFETAARLGGFTQAAKELNMTQGAISYQIKLLEECVGERLFLRHSRGVSLTPCGGKLAQSLGRIFHSIEDTLDSIGSSGRGGPIRISLPTSLGMKWFIRRIAEFRAHRPEIALRVFISNAPKVGQFDIGIRYGHGSWNDVNSSLLYEENIFLVCSPHFFRQTHIKSVDDLLDIPLLREADHHAFDGGLNWETWFSHVGLPAARPAGVALHWIDCTEASMVLEAAVEGHGMALVRGLMVADELALGRLVQPFEFSFPSGCGYYFTWPKDRSLSFEMQVIKEWIVSAIGDSVVSTGKRVASVTERPPRRPRGEEPQKAVFQRTADPEPTALLAAADA